MSWLPSGAGHLRDYLRFLALPLPQRRLVVYSEGPAYWPHLGPVVDALLARGGVALAYVSSHPDDPGLARQHPALSTFMVGSGHVRTMFFSALQADLVLMTMPDLNSFHIRRSARVGQYVYLHHALVSCHMVYRPGAFDHFDTVLCAGPHHADELRALEQQRGSAPKRLVPHGYGRLDTLLAAAATTPPPERLVLVAPSWGPQGLLETRADDLLQVLADTDWQVVVRPHPQTVRLAPQALACVQAWCRRSPRIQLDLGAASHASLQRAAVMVSDWSGAAFDFALGFERPVLFIDVPRKVNNPDYTAIAAEPIEVFGRAQLGRVLAPDQLALLPQALADLAAPDAARQARLQAFRQRWVHHPGVSASAAADWLLQALPVGTR